LSLDHDLWRRLFQGPDTMIGNFIGWCVFGLIAGAVSRLLTPGKDRLGCLGTMVVGVAGSFLCGGLAHLFFGSTNTEMEPAGFIGAVIGGIIVILLTRQLSRPGRPG
jgi:uncharacterized membrane protein YeaQ/YmgE (transglycosylase-associated protein family)